MAAEKPIISTRVKDVEREYSNCVHLVSDSNEFVEKVKMILYPKELESSYLKSYDDILNKTSWNSTVNRMKDAIGELISK